MMERLKKPSFFKGKKLGLMEKLQHKKKEQKKTRFSTQNVSKRVFSSTKKAREKK